MIENRRTDHEVEGSSDRAFGLTVGGILAAIAGYRIWSGAEIDMISTVLLAIAGPLILLGVVYPPALAVLNAAWTRLGLLMFKIVNPVVMFATYLVAIVPVGLLMRLFGKDPLNIKLDKDADSYWINRAPPGPRPESMKNQF